MMEKLRGDDGATDDDVHRGQNRTNRRSVLRTFGAASVLGTLGIVGSGRGGPQNTVAVPKAFSGDEVVEYQTVPEAWHDHVERTKTASATAKRRFGPNPNVFSVGLVRSPRTYGGKNGLQLLVKLAGQPATAIPDEVDGISVETAPAPTGYDLLGCYNNNSDTDVHGGEIMGWDNGGYGTACSRVEYNSSPYILHCAHVFWEDCSDVQNNGIKDRLAVAAGTAIGRVAGHDRDGDYAWIDHSESSGSFGTTIDDNDTHPDIKGHIARSTLADWVSRDQSNRPFLYKMGTTTGKTDGRAKEIDYGFTFSSCTDHDDGNGVYTYCDGAPGDSGGPTYHLIDGDAYITNLGNSGYNPHNRSYSSCTGDVTKYADTAGVAGYHLFGKGFKFGT